MEEGWFVLALIIGFVLFLAYRARTKVGRTSRDYEPKRPISPGHGPRGIWGGPGGELIDPGPTDGGTRPTE